MDGILQQITPFVRYLLIALGTMLVNTGIIHENLLETFAGVGLGIVTILWYVFTSGIKNYKKYKENKDKLKITGTN